MLTRTSRRLLALSLLLALPVLPAQAQQDAPVDTAQAIEAARQAADRWLAHIDAGDAEASYETAAEVLQNQITEAQWRGSLDAAQMQTGELVDRALVAPRYTTTLPDVPFGEYVILEYDSRFAHLAAHEVVVLTKENGDWKAAGYFARPGATPQDGVPEDTSGASGG